MYKRLKASSSRFLYIEASLIIESGKGEFNLPTYKYICNQIPNIKNNKYDGNKIWLLIGNSQIF